MADIQLIGVPMDCGKRRQGCRMGPDAMRVAGIEKALTGLGHGVTDLGDVAPAPLREMPPAPPQTHALAECVAWTEALTDAAQAAMGAGMPVFMGGDHALSLGTVAGVAAAAQQAGQKQFVLWLDAHSDFHSPETSGSGNLHGTPLGYVTGQPGFDAFPPLAAPIPERQVGLIGLRSVDGPEKAALQGSDCAAHDMREIDETGIAVPVQRFLDRVAAENGRLHVSLDVDFLDPSIAPAVGTTVPGGATFREAHLVMELLHESALVTSLDIVELNPFLDERGRTAALMVDLAASLMGRKVFDRPTKSYA